jgi:7-carboxy-7-deazaguanine synthase
MKPYEVKEIFYTLQGEGAHAGRPAVFCRFARCNLWSGHEADRSKALCQFCDTDFVGTDGVNGGRFPEPAALADAIAKHWPASDDGPRWVVCTGGEPLLQVDGPLTEALHARRFQVAIETNGTRPLPPGVDWVCVSPKAGTDLELQAGNELKLVFPQPGLDPERFSPLPFQHFFLQPMDGAARQANTRAAVDYCLGHPRWRLSIQLHKQLGIP